MNSRFNSHAEYRNGFIAGIRAYESCKGTNIDSSGALIPMHFYETNPYNEYTQNYSFRLWARGFDDGCHGSSLFIPDNWELV